MSSAVEPPGFVPPPPGIKANFVNPQHDTGGLVPLIAVFLSISTILLALRLYTKAILIKIFGFEDVIITLAWMCNVTLCGLLLKSLRLGSGVHIWDLTLPQFEAWLRNVYAAILVYVPAVALPKIAILLFYLRLNPEKYFRYSVFILLFITVGYMFLLMFIQAFACSPVHKFWTLAATGKCLNINTIYLVNPIINTICDVLILLTPVPMVLKLHVSRRYKLGLGLLFTIASMTIIISSVRIWAIAIASKSKDIPFHVTVSDDLIIIESNLTVACGCVIMLRPFFRHHFPGVMTKLSRGTGKSGGPSAKSPGLQKMTGEGSTVHGSQSNYRTKVSGGKNSKPHSGGGGWPGWSWTTAGRTTDEDDDMESLNAELKQFSSTHHGKSVSDEDYIKARRLQFSGLNSSQGHGTVTIKGGSEDELSGSSTQNEDIGVADGGPGHHYRKSNGRDYTPKDMEDGIMKTVSLDVR